MSFLSYFRSKKTSAAVAKERLQIIVARERAQLAGEPSYLLALKEDILEVIRKYVSVDQNAVRMEVDSDGDCEVLELNVVLPDRRD